MEDTIIFQVDGNNSGVSDYTTDTIGGSSTVDNSIGSDSDYDTEDEAFPQVISANLYPLPGQNVTQGEPLCFDVNLETDLTSSLPLCFLLNARSVFNKRDNLREMLHQIGPDI